MSRRAAADVCLHVPRARANVAAHCIRFIEELTPDKAGCALSCARGPWRALACARAQLGDLVRVVVGAGYSLSDTALTFRNLFWVKEGRVLVNGVSGFFKPGVCVLFLARGRRGTAGLCVGYFVGVLGQGATSLFEARARARVE